MPSLAHGGPWTVWDVKGLRPDRGRERWRPPGEEASGRDRSAPKGDEQLGVTRRVPVGEFTAEEAAHRFGILDRPEADAAGMPAPVQDHGLAPQSGQ